jgi:ATP-binding cassette subfamily B protein RaxB
VAVLPMTRIIVAHLRETILAADRIIVLEKGRIAADCAGRAAVPGFSR